MCVLREGAADVFMKGIDDGIYPSDLKDMSIDELNQLCAEIREKLINTLSETGGHLASNLGAVELTVAIHRVFDAPRDKIVWDVGHQSYVHKILTGRAGRFSTLRKYGGLSGFPKREESEYDVFDTGHSSNSISAALGMAAARDLDGDDYNVAAVIGDGAMTGGMVYEALNNAGVMDSGLVVILNDNGMSISRNKGSLPQHLNKLRSSEHYLSVKSDVKDSLRKIPVVGDTIVSGIGTVKDAIKYLVVPGVLFEELGFTYLGPVDGHDIGALIEVLTNAVRMKKPVVVHCITEKGKGYKPAEEHPDRFHGVGPFDKETGKLKNPTAPPTYSGVFGRHLMRMAEKDHDIVAISAAMIDGTGLADFARRFPDRIYDVGIAEEHAVTFAAGLAISGKKPFVAIYSTFLQRAYDQVLIDVCMQKLPVVFCLDRAGIVGNDGETHQGIFDLSYLSSMPNLTVLAPADGIQLMLMMEYAVRSGGPVAIRYPKGRAADLRKYDDGERHSRSIFRPHARLLREGADVTLASCGSMTEICLRASEILRTAGIECDVIDAGIIKPLTDSDRKIYMKSAEKTGIVFTAEDNVTAGGYGDAVETLFADDHDVSVYKAGWPDVFIPHGSCDELRHIYGLDAEGIARKVSDIIERKTGRSSGGKRLL